MFWLVRGSQLRQAGLVVLVGTGLAGLGYLINRAPSTALSYVRVLCWPAVATLAVFSFRKAILRMLWDIYPRELDLPHGRVTFQERQQHENEEPLDAFFAEDAAAAGAELENIRRGMRVAGLMLQSYEVQLEFLVTLGRAEHGLTRDAAQTWFLSELQRRGFNEEQLAQLNILELVAWMEAQDLLVLTPEGNLARSEIGDDLAELKNGFWYAPKAF